MASGFKDAVARISAVMGLKTLSGCAVRSIAVPTIAPRVTVIIVVAKDLTIVPSQVTKVRMPHIPSTVAPKRGKYAVRPSRLNPATRPVTAVVRMRIAVVATATCRQWSSLPATMAVSRRLALIRCQLSPWCSPVVICAAKPLMTSGRSHMESTSVDCGQMMSQVLPRAWNSLWWGRYCRYPDRDARVHSAVTAPQYQRLGALRFSQYQAARTDGRRRTASGVRTVRSVGCGDVVGRPGLVRGVEYECMA